jgi:hypothetical protein
MARSLPTLRALKIVAGSIIALLLIVIGFTYGLYFLGTRHIRADWGPTNAVYPESARRALWNANRGRGEPGIEPLSPPSFAWRIYRAGADPKSFTQDTSLYLAGQAARSAPGSPGTTAMYHLAGIAAAIQASRWPRNVVFDTVLEQRHQLRGNARRYYGRDVEALDDAQLHVLMSINGTGDEPWCQATRLRKRAMLLTKRWRTPPSKDALEAAFHRILPPPAGHHCNPQNRQP